MSASAGEAGRNGFRYGWLWFLSAQVGLCLLLLLIWPGLELDDSFIFLSYARHLAQSGLFAFNPGVVSYGFSSPAYVMLLAVVSRLSGIPVSVFLSNLLGGLMCGLSAASAWKIWSTLEESPARRDLILVSVLFSGPWFFTSNFLEGMETGLAVLSLLAFVLWLVKLRAGSATPVWLIVGILGTSVLATTRLESGFFIGTCLLLAFFATKSWRVRGELATVGAIAAAAEIAWLLYARRTFGSYMPWTSTGRLIYYFPGQFGLHSAEDFYHLGAVGRSILALKVIAGITFGGPLRILLIGLPLLGAALVVWLRREPATVLWTVRAIAVAMFVEIVLFAYLFPLVKDRHLAPYVAGIWVLLAPIIVRSLGTKQLLRAAAAVVFVGLWVGGAILFRAHGKGLDQLHRLAKSSYLKPGDKVAAEPIGIISFEAPVQIIDLGGLTQTDVWPFLERDGHASLQATEDWERNAGATKMVLGDYPNCAPERTFAQYCLVDVEPPVKSGGGK